MEQSFFQPGATADKAERYRLFLRQFSALIEDETDIVALLANTSAALREAFGFFWVGFYRVMGDELVLGPFQGGVACYRIRRGKGVCGTAWQTGLTQIVPDVEQFPGHIACSSQSRSEIVVPIFHLGTVWGVLDIDSDGLTAFDSTDRKYLEKSMQLLSEKIWNKA